MRRTIRTVLVVLLALVAAPAAAQAPRVMTLDDARDVVRVSDPRIAPDGRTVLVTVSRADFDVNEWRSTLVAVDVASGAERPVAPELRNVGHARWSPSGDRVAVLANAPAGASGRQVWILPAAGGDARVVTTAPSGVVQFAWRPDGQALAFVSVDRAPETSGLARFDDAFEVGNDHFLTTAPPEPSHLWVADLAGGESRRLTNGAWSVRTALRSPAISWSADGRWISIVRFPSASPGDSDQGTVQLVDARSGALRSLTGRTAREGDATFAPSGAGVAYTFAKDGDPANLSQAWVAPATGGQGRVLTAALDRDVSVAAWSADAQSLLLTGADGTRVSLWQQPIEGEARRLDVGSLASIGGVSLATGGTIALVGSESDRPAELYVKASAEAAPRRLTDFNRAIAALRLGRTEAITWDGPDGLPGDGVLTFPPDFRDGDRRPLVLLVHGGPTAASNEGFSLRAQQLAAEGWVVFQPNYRGSNNLGNAYQRAIANDAADGPGRDIMAGLDAVIRRGGVDADRVAVSGWSYGGYMTAWLIGKYPERWRAAVAGAAPVDVTDMSSLTDLNAMIRHAITESPWVGDNLTAAFAMSPIVHLPKIRTPTLLLSNTADVRVVVTGSYKLMQALRANGVPVQFIAYPIGGHSPADPMRQGDIDRRWAEWLRRYLNEGETRR
ncbi:MAG: S9 family peptidase [Vicinamibacterales bacterium]|nr:S9 family peptidase [Vicinamibacterales bacterium]